jgi:NADH:ubiquinone reductase (H+-translocating)
VHRIVVVGCGIAGIVIATHLSRRLTRSKTADVLLIDHNRAHVWKPMLHTFAAGTANYANENVSFVSQAKRSGFKYWPGELVGLDRSGKRVDLGPVPLPDATKTLPGRSIPYDTLILAVGSRATDPATLVLVLTSTPTCRSFASTALEIRSGNGSSSLGPDSISVTRRRVAAAASRA